MITEKLPQKEQMEHTGKMQNKVEKRVQKLIMVIGNETLPRKEIMADLELNGRRNFMARYLNPAIECGLVKMFLPESPNSPDQAYRLTSKGLQLLEKMNETVESN